MKKIYSSLGIILILFFVFACTLPSEVEITGSPSIKIAANMNFNDYFNDMLNNALTADRDTKIVPCTNTSYMTFLMHMEIFREENYKCEVDEDSFNPLGEGNVIINGTEIPVELHETGDYKKFLVLENNESIASSDEPYTLSFKGFDDYYRRL